MLILQRLIARSSRSLAVMTGFAGAADGRWRERRSGAIGRRSQKRTPRSIPRPDVPQKTPQ